MARHSTATTSALARYRVTQDRAQAGDRRTERVRRRRCVANDHGWAEFLSAGSAAGQPLQRQPAGSCARDHIGFGRPGRQLDEHMQPGCNASNRDARNLPLELSDQPVAPLPVSQPGPPYLPVVAARADELGER
jgi:hypothetical protein